jgi:hypothetical protein
MGETSWSSATPVGGRYRHDYSTEELIAWTDRIRKSGAVRVWAYFNKDREGYATKKSNILPASEQMLFPCILFRKGLNTELEINCKRLQRFSRMPQVFNGYKMRDMPPHYIAPRKWKHETKGGGVGHKASDSEL